jgi:uncharacterized protein (TIGR02118 family)
MARLVVLYKMPKDPAAFDRHYFAKHVPIAKKIPGLRKYEVSNGPIASAGGPSSYHLIATLHFDGVAALQAAVASAEGQAAAADLQNFAGAGLEMLLFESREL